MAEGQFRLRIRYCKKGRLCHLSHLELVHAQERIIRRAGLPFAVSQGFSPHMKLAFGPAIGVGTGSLDEYLDVWLTRYVDPQEALDALHAAQVPDLAVLQCSYVGDKDASLVTALTVSQYLIDLFPAGEQPDLEALIQKGLDDIRAAGSIQVMKKNKVKTYDLSLSTVEPARIIYCEDGVCQIELMCRSRDDGSLRPELFVQELSRVAGVELVISCLLRVAQYVEDQEGLHRLV
ncbi:MAG: DUF2344 domain-containing protein [Coriobacteriales bacterium]|nr:DUF2344 domain-containing protein [Coriobacteriales bacterium]MBQ6586440.1 DUF2344 domain-containing protein [Coriobacteriales bacterium]